MKLVYYGQSRGRRRGKSDAAKDKGKIQWCIGKIKNDSIFIFVINFPARKAMASTAIHRKI